MHIMIIRKAALLASLFASYLGASSAEAVQFGARDCCPPAPVACAPCDGGSVATSSTMANYGPSIVASTITMSAPVADPCNPCDPCGGVVMSNVSVPYTTNSNVYIQPSPPSVDVDPTTDVYNRLQRIERKVNDLWQGVKP